MIRVLISPHQFALGAELSTHTIPVNELMVSYDHRPFTIPLTIDNVHNDQQGHPKDHRQRRNVTCTQMPW